MSDIEDTKMSDYWFVAALMLAAISLLGAVILAADSKRRQAELDAYSPLINWAEEKEIIEYKWNPDARKMQLVVHLDDLARYKKDLSPTSSLPEFQIVIYQDKETVRMRNPPPAGLLVGAGIVYRSGSMSFSTITHDSIFYHWKRYDADMWRIEPKESLQQAE